VRALLDELAPFVHRRYLDYATLEDLKAMKRGSTGAPRRAVRARREARARRHPRDRVLGAGAAAGARRQGARLQARGTLPALERLAEPATSIATRRRGSPARTASSATSSTRSRSSHERQSQRIPDERGVIAGGAAAWLPSTPTARKRSRRGTRAYTGLVHATFDALFHGAEAERRREERPEAAALMDELGRRDRHARTPHDARLPRRRERDADLRLLRDGPRTRRRTPRRQRRWRRSRRRS
jgi:hypothetical protein